jgi:mRNA interferase HigB
MKVRLIKKSTVLEYILLNRSSQASFENWLDKLKISDWDLPSDINNSYNSADLLGAGSSRVVFDIKGNDHRMICQYFFGKNEVRLYVCWIGTHDEYDRICALNLQYTISEY